MTIETHDQLSERLRRIERSLRDEHETIDPGDLTQEVEVYYQVEWQGDQPEVAMRSAIFGALDLTRDDLLRIFGKDWVRAAEESLRERLWRTR